MRRIPHPTAYLIFATEILVGTMAIIVCLSFLLHISRDFLHDFDAAIIHVIYSFRSEPLTGVMKTITFFGGEIFLVLGILFLLISLWGKHKASSFNFAFLLVFGTVINLVLKGIFQRQRPDYMPLLYEATYSFPSGHAMNSFIFYSCVAYFLIRNTKNRNRRMLIVAIASLIVLLIGISRVYLGVHYPSDVIAGYIAGMLWFVLVVLVEKTAHKYKLLRRSS